MDAKPRADESAGGNEGGFPAYSKEDGSDGLVPTNAPGFSYLGPIRIRGHMPTYRYRPTLSKLALQRLNPARMYKTGTDLHRDEAAFAK
jgi:hypothetical protein